jgi:hypothetical protein
LVLESQLHAILPKSIKEPYEQKWTWTRIENSDKWREILRNTNLGMRLNLMPDGQPFN